MKNTYDYPYHTYKQKIANEIDEITNSNTDIAINLARLIGNAANDITFATALIKHGFINNMLDSLSSTIHKKINRYKSKNN
jgi:hypothetical protein